MIKQSRKNSGYKISPPPPPPKKKLILVIFYYPCTSHRLLQLKIRSHEFKSIFKRLWTLNMGGCLHFFSSGGEFAHMGNIICAGQAKNRFGTLTTRPRPFPRAHGQKKRYHAEGWKSMRCMPCFRQLPKKINWIVEVMVILIAPLTEFLASKRWIFGRRVHLLNVCFSFNGNKKVHFCPGTKFTF